MIKSIFLLSTLNGELGYKPTDDEYGNALNTIFNYNYTKYCAYRYFINHTLENVFVNQLILLYLNNEDRLCSNTTAYFYKDSMTTYNYTPEITHPLFVIRYKDVLPKGTILYFRDNIFKPFKKCSFVECNGWEDLCYYILKCNETDYLLDKDDFIFVPKFWKVQTNDGYVASLVSDVYVLEGNRYESPKLIGSFCLDAQQSRK